jgi:hypothetical protein
MFETGPARMTLAYWQYYKQNNYSPPTKDLFLHYNIATQAVCKTTDENYDKCKHIKQLWIGKDHKIIEHSMNHIAAGSWIDLGKDL